MRSKLTEKEWVEEFKDFIHGGEGVVVPEELSNRILKRVHKDLNPSSLLVFFKLLGVHLAVGTLSLAICHQFGLNPFGTEKSLSDWFMSIGGHKFCMIGCGVLFTALSIIAAGYFLSSDEVRVLRKTEFLQAFSLSVISLAAFFFFGAQLALLFGGLWLFGALVGGYAATEILWQLKKTQLF